MFLWTALLTKFYWSASYLETQYKISSSTENFLYDKYLHFLHYIIIFKKTQMISEP